METDKYLKSILPADSRDPVKFSGFAVSDTVF